MSDPQPPPLDSPLSLPDQAPGWGGRLLRGYSWWAVILRSVIYILILIPAVFGVSRILRLVRGMVQVPKTMNMFFLEFILAACVLLVAFLMSRIEGQKMAAYGLPLREAFGRLFWMGALAGLIEVSALIGLIAAGGGYSFGGLELHGSMILLWAGFWALFMCLVGIFEEFLFRGYVQRTLGKCFGFWPTAFLLSGLFGIVHLSNPGENWVGATSVVLVGLVLCLTLERTGSLWFAVGLHASFNFGQTFLFSVPDSGTVLPGHLSSARLLGPGWLTGGSVGPEGSLFCFLTMGLMAYAIHRIYPKKAAPAPPA